MNEHVLKPSELKLLLQCDGIENYKWKGFLRGGRFPKLLLENTTSNQEVVGKIVPSPSEGELKHWPKLLHPNINRLLDVVNIEHPVKIFISPVVGKCISDVIHDDNFVQHPLCFYRKKHYVKGVLLGLDYLHHISIHLLNLSDSNVAVCTLTDKAVICDFSCTVAKASVPKAFLPSNVCFKAPEIRNAKGSESVDCLAIDMWSCGVLFLQIFTQHLLPWRGIVDNSLECLDNEILRKANIGSNLPSSATTDLKRFLQKLLIQDPNLRFSAEEAYKSNFLHAQSRLDEHARNFWRSCEVPLLDQRNFAKNNGEFSPSFSGASELDVVNVLSNDHHCSGTDSRRSAVADNCPSDDNRTVFMLRTESEPGSKIYAETPNPCIRLYASFPSLKRHSSDRYAGHEEKGNDTPEQRWENREASTPLGTRIRCHELDPSRSELLSEFSSSKQIQEFPYEMFLTEWEANISENNSENSSNARHMSQETTEQATNRLFSSSHEVSAESFRSKKNFNSPIGGGEYEYHPAKRAENHWSESDVLGLRGDNDSGFGAYEHPKWNSFCSYTYFGSGRDVDANAARDLQNCVSRLVECGVNNRRNNSIAEVEEMCPSSPEAGSRAVDVSMIIDSSKHAHSQARIKSDGEDELPRFKKCKHHIQTLCDAPSGGSNPAVDDFDSSRKTELSVNDIFPENVTNYCLEHADSDRLATAGALPSCHDRQERSPSSVGGKRKKRKKRWFHRLCVCRSKEKK